MKKTYFAKVSDSMSWDVLKEKIEEQKRNNAQPLTFAIVAKVNVSSIDFDKLSLSIGKANALYAPYTTLSIATSDGIWNCILIRCSNDSRNILVYTAGNVCPLYASIIK
ncbi:hypothetical protein [Enterocloster clostridioformis]|uniref:hypothetical protein n=1 Tax=Enterocloster clostridioformis TaxID=1531 RepID=UPI0004877A87|nr:hypothetical protein [Enterocloster clostridioformis]